MPTRASLLTASHAAMLNLLPVSRHLTSGYKHNVLFAVFSVVAEMYLQRMQLESRNTSLVLRARSTGMSCVEQ